MATKPNKESLLNGARVYLSGPMDFVASRANEAKFGWRNRVKQFLASMGVVVFDPWTKPEVRGLHDYGREGADTTDLRNKWTFEDGPTAAETRAGVTGKFWETLHIDLRMVDTADFIVAYCPTNVYSVGTPHEIALCRQQRKPVLLVSPPITFESLDKLKAHLKKDEAGTKLLDSLIAETGIKENPRGLPSLWYMPLVGGQGFFDGFGFAPYMDRFKWERVPLDDHEDKYRSQMKRPLLPFLERLQNELPKKWDNRDKKFVPNDDWLLWDLKPHGAGAVADEPKQDK